MDRLSALLELYDSAAAILESLEQGLATLRADGSEPMLVDELQEVVDEIRAGLARVFKD